MYHTAEGQRRGLDQHLGLGPGSCVEMVPLGAVAFIPHCGRCYGYCVRGPFPDFPWVLLTALLIL